MGTLGDIFSLIVPVLYLLKSVPIQLSLIVSLLVASAYGQQPVAELGGWPPGAFTLFVGVWLAGRIGLQRNYDTSFPPCTRAGLHRILWVKRLLWCRKPMGQSVTRLVLSSQQSPPYDTNFCQFFTTDGTGIWEWDILTIYRHQRRPTVYFSPTGSGSEHYELKILAPTRCSLEVVIKFRATLEISEATDALFASLFHQRYACVAGADAFLLCWRGLQNFQHSGELLRAGGEDYDCTVVHDAVRSYRSRPEEVVDWPHADTKLRLYIQNPIDTDNEAAPGSTIRDDALFAGQLVALLIYIKSFPRDTNVNPLIPLLWCWAQGGLSNDDNFFFDLRAFKKITIPAVPTAGAAASAHTQSKTSHVNTRYEIELSDEPVVIDGGGYMGSQKYAWFWSTALGAIITFFASMVGTSNPSFATAIGLSLLRPYSNDDNLKDYGSPLSWNGRRRVRWGELRACGIFSGMTQLRLGRTGNSLHRGCVLFVTSWLAWYWRPQLRILLNFQPNIPETARWVQIVAVLMEFHSGLWMFLGAYLYFGRGSYSVVVINCIAGTHVMVVVGMMIYHLCTGAGLWKLFVVAEAFTIPACLVTGQTFVGAGAEHVYVHHAVTLYWSHIIATSCFAFR